MLFPLHIKEEFEDTKCFPRTRVAQWVGLLDYLTTRTSLSPIQRGFAPGFCKLQKGRTRLITASDKVYQLHAHGRWFSPCTPASSTTKPGRHDRADILLKNQINQPKVSSVMTYAISYIWRKLHQLQVDSSTIVLSSRTHEILKKVLSILIWRPVFGIQIKAYLNTNQI